MSQNYKLGKTTSYCWLLINRVELGRVRIRVSNSSFIPPLSKERTKASCFRSFCLHYHPSATPTNMLTFQRSIGWSSSDGRLERFRRPAAARAQAMAGDSAPLSLSLSRKKRQLNPLSSLNTGTNLSPTMAAHGRPPRTRSFQVQAVSTVHTRPCIAFLR